MSPMKPMTEAAMLAEIEKALKPAKGEDGFTLAELANKMGVNPNNRYAMIQLGMAVTGLIAKGKACKVRVRRSNVWGAERTLWGVAFRKSK